MAKIEKKWKLENTLIKKIACNQLKVLPTYTKNTNEKMAIACKAAKDTKMDGAELGPDKAL